MFNKLCIERSRKEAGFLLLHTTLPVLTGLLFTIASSAQCISTTTKNGSVYTSNNSAGNFPFSNSSRASTSDNQRASATALALLLNGNTEYLKITGFNFSVPPTAIICGVTMVLERRALGITVLATVTDNNIRMVKNGAMEGNNVADPTAEWTETDAMVSYGSPTNSWGTFLTPQDVNSAQFGIAVSAKIRGLLGVLPSAQVDYVGMTLYYNMPNVLPLQITGFTTSLYNATVTNQWHVETPEPGATITLQRSLNGEQWQAVKQYTHLQPGIVQHTETISDNRVVYYRLQLKATTNTRYSNVNQVRSDIKDGVRLSPNPAADVILVSNVGQMPISVYNSSGQKLHVPVTVNAGRARLDVRALPKGLYILKTAATAQTFLKN